MVPSKKYIYVHVYTYSYYVLGTYYLIAKFMTEGTGEKWFRQIKE